MQPGGLEQLPRRGTDSVIAAQVAGIVVGDPPCRQGREGKPAGSDQLEEELRMVDDLKLTSELPVFVLEGVESSGGTG